MNDIDEPIYKLHAILRCGNSPFVCGRRADMVAGAEAIAAKLGPLASESNEMVRVVGFTDSADRGVSEMWVRPEDVSCMHVYLAY